MENRAELEKKMLKQEKEKRERQTSHFVNVIYKESRLGAPRQYATTCHEITFRYVNEHKWCLRLDQFIHWGDSLTPEMKIFKLSVDGDEIYSEPVKAVARDKGSYYKCMSCGKSVTVYNEDGFAEAFPYCPYCGVELEYE